MPERYRPPALSLLQHRIPDALGDVDELVARTRETAVELAAGGHLAQVGLLEEGRGGGTVDLLELALPRRSRGRRTPRTGRSPARTGTSAGRRWREGRGRTSSGRPARRRRTARRGAVQAVAAAVVAAQGADDDSRLGASEAVARVSGPGRRSTGWALNSTKMRWPTVAPGPDRLARARPAAAGCGTSSRRRARPGRRVAGERWSASGICGARGGSGRAPRMLVADASTCEEWEA